MKIDIGPLLRGESTAPVVFDYDLPDLPADISDSVMAGNVTPVHIAGRVSFKSEILTFAASAEFTYRARCARCDCEVTAPFRTEVEKFVVASLENNGEGLDDYILAESAELDADDLMLQFIQLEMPMRFLCREDCKGLCVKCGADLNNGKCGCPERDPDPRFAKLNDYGRE